MKDREFLIWLHERLEHVYKEPSTYDFMHKLRAIIKNTPENQYSPDMGSYNSLEDLIKYEFKN